MEASLLLMGTDTFAKQTDGNGNDILPVGLYPNMGAQYWGLFWSPFQSPIPNSYSGYLDHLLLYGLYIYPFF